LSDTRPSTTPSMKRKLLPQETATLLSLLATSLDLSSSPLQRTSAAKLRIFKERSTSSKPHDNGSLDYYQITQNKFLIVLMNKTKCQACVHIAGVDRGGLYKLFGIMNIPPPVDEDHYTHLDKYILPFVTQCENESMKNAVKSGDTTDLTVSGDGSWQKRSFSSVHGVSTIISSNTPAKIIDTICYPKKCSICQGALSIKHSDKEKYKHIIKTIYIGDGDSKIMPRLREVPQYDNVEIQKIEDINHWSKKMLNRLEKIKNELKDTIIDGKKELVAEEE
ncbi:unnamed protein product, partial [Didymodactylos carnosus]